MVMVGGGTEATGMIGLNVARVIRRMNGMLGKALSEERRRIQIEWHSSRGQHGLSHSPW